MVKLIVPVGMRRSLRLALLVATFETAAMPTHLSALDVAATPTLTPTATPLPCTLLFSGRVADSISGAAIDGASLCLSSGFCTQADPTGAYAGLCYPGASSAGTQLCAEAAGYKKACQGPWTPTGGSLEVNFALEPVATPTPTPTVPIVDHPTPTPTPTPAPCFGDCDGNGEVSVNEVVILVNVALGSAPLSSCPAGDRNGDGQITIDEIIGPVLFLLNGCPESPPFAPRGVVTEFPRAPVACAA